MFDFSTMDFVFVFARARLIYSVRFSGKFAVTFNQTGPRYFLTHALEFNTFETTFLAW